MKARPRWVSKPAAVATAPAAPAPIETKVDDIVSSPVNEVKACSILNPDCESCQ